MQAWQRNGDRALRVAFVNNMPDPAFVATERQFLGLVDQAAAGRPVDIRCYGLSAIRRHGAAAEHLAARYLPVERIWDTHPDAVLVTGAEPTAPSLDAEPYWDQLDELLGWAARTARTVLASCLAAHAVLTAVDGLARVSLPAKCTGVFDQDVVAGHPLTAGLPPQVAFPHSRVNEVPAAAVAAAGWSVLVGSGTVGWTVAAKPIGQALAVLVQGHPEYEATTLLREYRRDAARWLAGTTARPPCLPQGGVAVEDHAALADHHAALLAGAVPAELPFDALAARARCHWRPAAVRLYRNWLGVAARPVDTERSVASSAG